MNRTIYLVLLTLAACAQPFASRAKADLFGSGANIFNIDFVTIGNPNNPADTTDRPVIDGAVAYVYRIGKYEISEEMINKANALGGLGVTHDGRGANFPATSISWFEGAKLVNWLNTSTGSVPAYKFDEAGNFQLWLATDPGYDASNLYRNSLARYFLPTLSEWHKAAYYDPVADTYYDYPLGSNSVPDGIDFPGDPTFDAVFFDGGLNSAPNEIANVGLTSPYGTFGQGGNVAEWLETAFDRSNTLPTEHREIRGSAWNFGPSLMAASNDGVGQAPALQDNWNGLRVVSVVPEPSTIVLVVMSLLSFATRRIVRPAR